MIAPTTVPFTASHHPVPVSKPRGQQETRDVDCGNGLRTRKVERLVRQIWRVDCEGRRPVAVQHRETIRNSEGRSPPRAIGLTPTEWAAGADAGGRFTTETSSARIAALAAIEPSCETGRCLQRVGR